MKNTKIEKYKVYLVSWLRDWFETNGKDCNAIVGISGGKDSTVVAALCVEALGKDRVIGVLMPNGEQNDITDSYAVCRHLGIKYIEVNMQMAYSNIIMQMQSQGIKASEQTKINLGPRLRMSTLYAVSQSVNGRVIGTSNLDEYLLGFCTRWGDSVADVEPIINMHVSEVIELGLALGLPEYLVKKTPSDGLTGSSDEEKFGFTYKEFEEFYNKTYGNLYPPHLYELNEKQEKMVSMFLKSGFKRKEIPHPSDYPCFYEYTDALSCSTCTNSKGCITCTDGDQYTGGEQDV
jgi:NAD+ synthase